MDRVRWGDGADFMVRVQGPVLLLCGVVVGFGLAVVGPLSGPLNVEDSVNQGLADRRNGVWNSITYVWSFLGSTEAIVGVCLVVFAGVLWHSRDWRLAVVPAMAIVLQLGLYLTVTGLIHRERPSVERMDALPPLSSYPSGHVGASTALYLALILIASRVERVGVRWTIIGICATVPLLVGVSRLYRGVHYISDIIVGMLCGAGCALLAHGWYRHRMHAATVGARSGP